MRVTVEEYPESYKNTNMYIIIRTKPSERLKAEDLAHSLRAIHNSKESNDAE